MAYVICLLNYSIMSSLKVEKDNGTGNIWNSMSVYTEIGTGKLFL